MSATEEKPDVVETPIAAESSPETAVGLESPPPTEVVPAKKKMSGEVKLFIGILVGAVVLGAAAMYPALVGPPKPAEMKPHTETRTDINRAFLIPAGSHIKGDPNAKYSLVVFSDFQCPSCKKGEPLIDKALKDQKGKFNVVFRHFQAALQHQHSRTLGIASEAAGLQGKFFEMAEKLFDEQDAVETASADEVKTLIDKAAKGAGLDMDRFHKDQAGSEAARLYDADQSAAEKAGLRSTPAYYFVPPAGKPTAISTTADAVWWVADPKNYK